MTKIAKKVKETEVTRPLVYLARGGAPDKMTQGDTYHKNVRILPVDQLNLYSMSVDDLNWFLVTLVGDGSYFVPADERDIKVANDLVDHVSMNHIILPKTTGGKILNHDDISKFNVMTKWIKGGYAVELGDVRKTPTLLPKKFSKSEFTGVACKSSYGSGSREVLIADPNRSKFGLPFVDQITKKDYDRLKKMDSEDNPVYLEQLIPYKWGIQKVNVDFIIKGGQLKFYKFDLVESGALTTNWNHGTWVRDKYTDKIMKTVVRFLTKEMGVRDAVMNFEAFMDTHEFYLVEFNWRYSNSMFETEAIGINMIDLYFDKEWKKDDFRKLIPIGFYKEFVRAWTCKFHENTDATTVKELVPARVPKSK